AEPAELLGTYSGDRKIHDTILPQKRAGLAKAADFLRLLPLFAAILLSSDYRDFTDPDTSVNSGPRECAGEFTGRARAGLRINSPHPCTHRPEIRGMKRRS